MSTYKDDLVFGDDTKVTASSSTPSQPLPYTKPQDNFSPLPVSASTVFYLAVTAPHTDTYVVHGPAPSFADLIPTITHIASDSPRGLEKLEKISVIDDAYRERDNPAFIANGFHKIILDGQRGVYTVLEVIAVDNAEVKALLPAPVYTVISHGPLTNTESLANSFSDEGGKSKVVAGHGRAATSALVGSFAERNAALEAAKTVMDELVEGVDGVARSEVLDEGAAGGGVLMAAKPGVTWEVRVRYRKEVLEGALDRAEAEGKEVEWRF
jgi:hypothetical protein